MNQLEPSRNSRDGSKLALKEAVNRHMLACAPLQSVFT
jgi:hypothetical protein